MRSITFWAFASVVLVLATQMPGLPQTITASLEGVVKDPTGATIAGAQVQMTNTATNIATRLTTDSMGRFLAPSLPPGPYAVTVEAPGFKKAERSRIVLEVNQAARLDFTMELGTATETVNVSGTAPLLESSSSTMGQVVNTRSIVDLPLNERNSWSLVFLAPGVSGGTGDKYNNVNFSIDGGRPGSSALMVDGIASATPLTNPIQGFTIFPEVDTVQEFKVETDNYSAEFGRSGSGVINLVYKSGTNQLHGSAFDFLRNSDMDANGFFSNRNGVPLPSFKRNQFGGAISGPVYVPKLYNGRNRTFFLFGYEGLREASAASLTTTVPTALERAGDFSQLRAANGSPVVIYDPATTTPSGSGFMRQPFPGNAIPASRFDPVAANVMKFFPLPNQPGNLITGANNYYIAATSPESIDNYDAKIDENVNDRHRFFVRFSRRLDDQVPPNYFPAEIRVADGGTEILDTFVNAALDYTYTLSPTFLINVRYGFGRAAEDRIPVSLGFDPTQLGMPAYMRSADAIMFPGFAAAGYQTLGNGGTSNWGVAGYDTHSFLIDAMKVAHAHLIKFGFDWRVMQANIAQEAYVDGTFSFDRTFTQGPNPNQASATAGDAIASLLLGTGSGQLNKGGAVATQSEYYSAYMADDWKVSTRLTLNLGFRYGIDVPLTERYNQMDMFDPNVASPLAGPAGLPGLKGGLVFAGAGGYGRRLAPTDLKGWDPRFGFAYQLAKHSVMRGGFGVFHAPSSLAASGAEGRDGFQSVTLFVSAANGVTPANYVSNPFPGGLLPITGNSRGLLTSVGTNIMDGLLGVNRVPYTENWNFNLQQQLPGAVLLQAGYVGNRGVQLSYQGVNLDQLRPEQLSPQLQQQVANPFFGLIPSGPLSTATVPYSYLAAPFPQYTMIAMQYTPGATSIYNSVQLKAEKQFGSGFTFLASYTGQKLIDDYSITAVVGANAAIQNRYNLRGERAVSSIDVSQLLTLSYVYELPVGKGKRFGRGWNRAANAALGNWQINGITSFATGLPLVVTTQNTSGSGSAVLRPNNNGQSAKLSGSLETRLNEYFNTSVFSQPAPFTFGNTGRTLPDVRAPGLKNFDLSLFKNLPLAERFSLQIRAEAFNALNTPRFGAPNTSLNSAQFGVISTQANSPRQLQFALKLLF